MARPPVDYSASKRFVEFVMGELGVSGPTELATRLELRVNSARTVTNWLAPSSAPSFTHTMAMLSAAGLLQPEAVAEWENVSLEEARRRVDERRSAAGHADAVSKVAGAAARDRLEAREPSQTRQKENG